MELLFTLGSKIKFQHVPLKKKKSTAIKKKKQKNMTKKALIFTHNKQL